MVMMMMDDIHLLVTEPPEVTTDIQRCVSLVSLLSSIAKKPMRHIFESAHRFLISQKQRYR